MSNKNTKRRKIVNIIMIFIFVVGFVIFFTSFFSYKNRIFRMVRGNIDLLNQSVQSASYDDAYKIKRVKNISKYSTSDGNTIIDYFCHGFGLVPSSIYYGFYYSSDGKPAGFQGANYGLLKEGNGWTWLEKKGDNRYYTEHILGNWYYYKAGF